MQGDREVNVELLTALAHRGHDAGRRQRDPPLGQRQALAIHDDAQCGGDVVVVIERLAHAHHHHVGDHARMVRGGRPLAEGIAGEHHLAYDFGCRQVADQPLRTGVAELAGEGTADLAGDTQGAAIRLGNMDSLDLVAVGELEQPLGGAVDAVQRLGDLWPLDDEFIGQLLPEILRQVGHGVEVGDAVPV